jgi:transposase
VLDAAAMKFSAEQRHHILTAYTPNSRNNSLRALSIQYGLAADGRTIKRWLKRWDGTVASLQDRKSSGRPRLLTPTLVHNHIRQPIIASNRSHVRVSYTDIHNRIRERNPVQISLRSVRRYGQVVVGARQLRTRRQSVDERKHTRFFVVHRSLMLVAFHSIVLSVLFSVTPYSVG